MPVFDALKVLVLPRGKAVMAERKQKKRQPSRRTKAVAPRSRAGVRQPALTASTADRHDLYQRSVQAPEMEIEFVDTTFRTLRKRRPVSFREDFCGTALLSATWVKSQPERTATGVDIDRSVLDWGMERNLNPLGEQAQRVSLLCQDVRETGGRYDVVGAFNFSYWIFRSRDELRHYFRCVRRCLGKDGAFFLDAYGGWESHQPMLEPRRIQGGFTYVWDQDSFCPITHEIVNHIHFEFRDGSRMEKAFTYEWRFWSLPELRELLLEAGFSEVRVYWDDSEDDEDSVYRPKPRAANQPGWLAYIVALR